MVVTWYLIVDLICISLIISELSIFSCAYWQFVYVISRNVYSDPLPFLTGFLSFCYWVVRDLNTSPSSDIGPENIFFHLMGCLLTFLIVSSETQKFLILIKSNIAIFLLSHLLLVSYLRKHFLIQHHEDLLLCFFLRVL